MLTPTITHLLIKIAHKATETRQQQKQYFRTRQEYDLKASKAKEQELDTLIAKLHMHKLPDLPKKPEQQHLAL